MNKNWEIKTLGEVCEVIAGQSPESRFYNKNGKGLPFYQGKKDFGDVYLNPPIVWTENVTKEAVEGDILMSVRAPVGPTNFATQKICIGRGLAAIRSKDKMNKNYLFYFFKFFEESIETNKGAVFDSINKKQIEDINLLVPPLVEQKRIVKILDEKFEAIEELKKVTEQQIVDVKELFESRLNEMFEKILTTNNLVVMSDIYDVRDGTHESPKYQNDGYPLVTSKNLKDGELLMENIKYISEKDYLDICRRSEVSRGDVLLAMIGTIGNPVVIKDEPNFAIKNVALFKVPVNQDSDFLRYYLMTKLVIDKMKKDAKGATQKFVGLGYLRSFLVPDVSFFEQKKIIKELDELSEKTKELEAIFRRKIADLEELKKSYLEQAFSGNL